MSIAENIVQALGRGSELVRAKVTGLDPARRLLVQRDGDAAEWRCVVLVTGKEPVVLEPGDEVLVLVRREGDCDGIVLGRVGLAALPDEVSAPDTATIVGSQHEKRVVIEADEELILRVGESSVRITSDGKVVIRGQHVLTRAKGTNRIKGGSVAIN